MNTDELLKDANDRLKVANTGITIFKRGAKLSLRGMLPCKPPKIGKAQQTIALDVYANPAGIKRAEKEALILSGKLALNQFDWEEYRGSGGGAGSATTVGQLIESFERDYFSKRERTPKTETTWKVEYLSAFAKLDKDKPITKEGLLEAILSSNPDTRTRKRLCWVYTTLAKFAGLDFDASAYAGRYKAKQHKLRKLPTDEDIIAMRESIESPEWKLAFSLMAAYGLRNHEVFNLDRSILEQSPVLTVLDGKTGRRKVWPFRPEWWQQWKLWEGELPNCTGKNNSDIGSRVTKYFSRKGLCNPYDLRHAWAVRTLEMGLDISLAAAQMGHSLTIHSEIYHDFISDRTHQKAFEAILKNDEQKKSLETSQVLSRNILN